MKKNDHPDANRFMHDHFGRMLFRLLKQAWNHKATGRFRPDGSFRIELRGLNLFDTTALLRAIVQKAIDIPGVRRVHDSVTSGMITLWFQPA